jgi:hypothetical protein
MKSQSQFNWIFIIVAGAIILTFFISFTLKFKSLQEEKLSMELLINLDRALFNLQSSSYNTFDIVEIPKNVELTCNNFKIGNRNYQNDKLIFSPKNLKDKLYIWYKPFNFPFKINNFYYLISPDDRFYLIYNPNDDKAKDFIDSLIDDLPDKFKNNVKSFSSRVKDGKNIFINTNSGITQKDVKIILNQDKISLNYNNRNYDDVEKELVYGIIFSDDFDCVYNRLRSDLEKTIAVYQKKSLLLQNSNCDYVNFNQYLIKLKDLKSSDLKPVEELNQNLDSINCPVLY